MPDRLFRLYQRKRIINVNVNVIAAGLVAVALTLIPVSMTRLYTDKIWVIVLTAGIADAVFDVLLYYALHWVANNWRPLKPKSAKDEAFHKAKKPPFFRDATLIQFERAIISPIYYVVALGIKYWMLTNGYERELALVVGFVAGIFVTRMLHTIWGLYTGRFTLRSEPAEKGSA